MTQLSIPFSLQFYASYQFIGSRSGRLRVPGPCLHASNTRSSLIESSVADDPPTEERPYPNLSVRFCFPVGRTATFRNRLLRLLPSRPTVALVTQTGRVHRGRLVCGIAEWKARGNGNGLRKHIRLRLNGQAFDVATYCPLRRSANTYLAGRCTCPFPSSWWKVGPSQCYSR